MSKKIYVGGLAYSVTDMELNSLFTEHGSVESAVVVKDRETDNSRGFGFVEMGSEDEAQKAIQALNGSNHEGRELKVNLARPKTDRPRNDNYSRDRY